MYVFHVFQMVVPNLEFIARAGGGGSGGGGGVSGHGGGVGGVAAIGYLPVHYVTAWCYKRFSFAAAVLAGSIVGVVVTALFALTGSWLTLLVGGGAAAGVYGGLHNWLARAVGLARGNKKHLEAAASKDPAWHEPALKTRIAQVFTDFQQDWTTFNLEHIRGYVTDRYYQHVSLMLAALKIQGRQNIVGDPQLRSTQVVTFDDRLDDTQDTFVALIDAKANDVLMDTQNNLAIYTDKSTFNEYWHFQRQGNQWYLDQISQATADPSLARRSLETFAQQNDMYYSLDWGWLLLPQRGQLFGQANFKNSDINNHVIGSWSGIVVQLYTYVPLKKQPSNHYLIAQIALPKSYGGIIIKRRGAWGFLSRAPRGYQKVSFEWPDFNKRYSVYTTDYDRLTSFELLNPKFMADLYDKNLGINIEVVDNIVYLYAKVNQAETRYADMLDILKQAFKELKL
jgi:hypothetical protein